MQTRYELGDIIASGGMAEVYRAHDKFLGREVAVKVFHASATAEIDFQRQQGEVNVLARLNHPNLVTLLDAAVDRSDPDATRIYYVMELVEGTDLKRRLDQGSLVPRQIAQIGYYTAVALEYVHSQGIVHRDVKPANILLTFNGDGTRVTAKLGDFGVASIGPAEAISDDEVVTGTVAYLSPEQARGEEVGPASDVYALGLVLLQCFTGTLAFPGPPQQSAMNRLLDDPEIPESVPAEWVPLLRAMTAASASERPDIHDIALALRQMFAAESGRHRAELGTRAHDQGSAALQRYDLLGSPSDDAFDRITSIATRVVGSAVAMVSIVGQDHLWFASAPGLDIPGLVGDPALLASAIVSDKPVIIEDARTDPSATGNPLLAEESGLRFFAGVPLVAPDGVPVGMLCVLDGEPRTISEDDLATLTDLSAVIVGQLELRRQAKSLADDSEAAWFGTGGTDENSTLITNRPFTGPVELSPAPS